MNEQEIVKASLTEIFRRNGYHDPEALTQRDFDHISQEIDRATGILVSGTTIKRLASGRFSRSPQIATLDAVSRYLGFRNWQEYKTGALTTTELPDADSHKPVHSPRGRGWLSRYWKAVSTACVIAVALAAFVQLSRRPGDFGKASFTFRKTTTSDIPNTVVFSYDVTGVTADSFFIQQSWDKNRRIRIDQDSHTLTDIYYEPGYHIAKLIANDSVIRAVDVYIPTNGWFFFAKEKPTSNPEYIRRRPGQSPGDLTLTRADLLSSKIDITKEKEYTSTFFPGKMQLNSDDFTFTATVRVKEVKSNFCPYISFEIYTQRYPLFLKITPGGCVNEASMQLGEQFISGQTADLGFLGCDVRQTTQVELRVRQRNVTIFLNRKKVYAGSYQESSRLITGLGIMSNGLCEFENVELKGADGTILYSFEKPHSL